MNLNKIIKIVIYMLLTPLSLIAQQQKGFTIHGQIPGLKNGEKVAMWLFYDKGFEHDVSDSAYVKNNEFLIKGIAPDGPRTYLLLFGKRGSSGSLLLFINNNENIEILSHKSLEQIVSENNNSVGRFNHFMSVEGSPTNYAFWSLGDAVYLYQQTMGTYDRSLINLKDSIGFDRYKVESTMADKNTLSETFYWSFLKKPEPDHLAAIPEIVFDMYETGNRPAFLHELYNQLDDNIKNTHYGKFLKIYADLCVGQSFPEFYLPQINGTLLNSKEIFAKSKLTIVHFWASTSLPSMLITNHQELLSAYKMYHNRGLNVIGVSGDTDAKKWQEAVKTLPWYQVCDLKGRNGVVGKVYNEYGRLGWQFPNVTNVLIDQNGKIVAWDVQDYELQWYLWKYLEDKS
ncbi:MAG: AhpC/TSA family protein [Mucilaginibacter sp.]|nr:AhpC/TSA family protein [Mucilaginibacter sp.]